MNKYLGKQACWATSENWPKNETVFICQRGKDTSIDFMKNIGEQNEISSASDKTRKHA